MSGGVRSPIQWAVPFQPESFGTIEREARARLVGRRILALGEQRRHDCAGYRVELQLSGSELDLVRLSSAAEIAFELGDSGREAENAPDPAWAPSRFLRLARGADGEFHRQFLRLWDAAGTTKYSKEEWRKFCRMLQEAGYWV